MSSERFYGSYTSSTSFMNYSPWTIVLVIIWTYQTLPNYSTEELRSHTWAHFDTFLLYSLWKLWIGWQWLQQVLWIHHWTCLHHEFIERRQTCYTGWRSLQIGIVARCCHGIGGSCCKISLSTIFQLFQTCSSGPHCLYAMNHNWLWLCQLVCCLFFTIAIYCFVYNWVGDLAAI